ncbi:uncharacterized mitochondrial protein AtMg00810-like [Rutidosis leptorrhynchoides]|uniref:uncharacterized mitochondrial protein AtMg00810-like n=1 Tax=Rutidosis leptorrhynchoides TaxID=125765 RepID=UPI003A99EC2F
MSASTSPSPIPLNPIETLNDPHWKRAMTEEFHALIKNGTWELLPRTPDMHVIRSMWIFKHKFHSNCSFDRYKTRLVGDGRSQQVGIDCTKTFSPMVKPSTIRRVLSLALRHSWSIRQLDVKNAFLYGNLSETVYMHQPSEFSMTDLGNLSHFLVVAVSHTPNLFLNQSTYAMDILERADMLYCKPSKTPFGGSFAISNIYRPDISYAVQQICLHMHALHDGHMGALKRILRYVKGTIDYDIHLNKSASRNLVSYTDPDWAGCLDTRRCTSGYCVYLGDNLISWSSKRQPTISLSLSLSLSLARSSAEAEYRGVSNDVSESC